MLPIAIDMQDFEWGLSVIAKHAAALSDELRGKPTWVVKNRIRTAMNALRIDHGLEFEGGFFPSMAEVMNEIKNEGAAGDI
jgi:hypothetical protein